MVAGAHAYRDRLGKRFGDGVTEPGRGRVSPLGLGHTIGQSCPQKDGCTVPLVRKWQLHLELVGLAPWWSGEEK